LGLGEKSGSKLKVEVERGRWRLPRPGRGGGPLLRSSDRVQERECRRADNVNYVVVNAGVRKAGLQFTSSIFLYFLCLPYFPSDTPPPPCFCVSRGNKGVTGEFRGCRGNKGVTGAVASDEWLVASNRSADEGVGRSEMAREQRPLSIASGAYHNIYRMSTII